MVATPVFDRGWWDSYVKVNKRFADACAQIAADGAIVWVQDYQLQLVPAMLREQRPDLRIGFFLHIPFPPTELFMQLPWRAEIIRGLLGADLVGFHRPGGAQNYLWLARRLIGLEPSRGAVGVRTRPGVVQVGDRYGAGRRVPHLHRRRPAWTPWPAAARSSSGPGRSGPTSATRARSSSAWTGSTTPRASTCGCYALQELLTEGRVDPSEVAMVQLATPSRERVEHYQRMRGEIEQVVSRINGEFARVGRPVVHYLHQSIDRKELAAFFSAADVMLVTPVRDGMNLVCKEYVACRHDLGGALVLSEFAGAAAELTSAFLVNPHDLDGVKNAMHAALAGRPGRGPAADAGAAPPGADPRRRPLGQVVPRRAAADAGAAHVVASGHLRPRRIDLWTGDTVRLCRRVPA